MVLIRRSAWILLAIYWLTLGVLTHVPKLRPVGREVGDKTAHLLAYGFLAILFYLALCLSGLNWRRCTILVFLLAALYGIADELTQPYVGRSAEFRDWVADVGGAATGALLMGFAHSLVVRSRRPRPETDALPALEEARQ